MGIEIITISCEAVITGSYPLYMHAITVHLPELDTRQMTHVGALDNHISPSSL